VFKGCRVGVVVPAYNEERQIEGVLATMPDFVDRIFVIDDCSADKTSDVTKHWAKGRGNARRVQLIRHETRGGVGRSITTGYKAALEDGMEVVAVMAGDGQMDPKELPMILEPVADGKADYSKGNRLTSGVAWEKTPHVRLSLIHI